MSWFSLYPMALEWPNGSLVPSPHFIWLYKYKVRAETPSVINLASFPGSCGGRERGYDQPEGDTSC